jgi:hypothetical protein
MVENTPNHFEHKVKALNHGTGDVSKPADTYGVRYARHIDGEKSATGANPGKTKFRRKTTLTVTHTEADKGNPSYYTTCYGDGRGDTGP